MIPALESGRVDAIGEVTPFVEQAKSKGARVLDYPGISTFREGAVGLWVATGSFVDSNADVVQRFRRAMHKANTYANEHIDEAQAKAAEVTRIPLEILEAGEPPYWPDAVEPGEIDRAAQVMVDLGYLTAKPAIDALVV